MIVYTKNRIARIAARPAVCRRHGVLFSSAYRMFFCGRRGEEGCSMFRKEDYVVYGDLGVCQVQDIVERKFDGLDKAHLYYVLAPVYQDGVLYVPADNPRIFLRAVISAEEANRLIDQIPTMEGKAFHSRSAQELSAHYEEAMRTHSCADLIRLTMSIHTKKRDLASQKKKFGRVDEHFMKRAEDSLNGEFAIALGIPREEVPGYISRRIAALAPAKS